MRLNGSASQAVGSIGFLLILLLLPGFSCDSGPDGSAGGSAAPAAENRLTILHTNDMHSHLQGVPNVDYTPFTTGDDDTLGGMARIATKVNETREARALEGVPVLLVDAGDFMMGTLFHLLGGEAEMGVMNHIGYDYTTFGNHEFDWLPAGAAGVVDHAAGLPIDASNLGFNDNPDPGADALQQQIAEGKILPYSVRDLFNGLKVGLFGIMGENADDVIFKPDPETYPLTFTDRVEAAADTVALLREDLGVDLVVCMSHSGVDAGDPSQGEDPELAQAVPGIDVIISGHTHTNMPEPVITSNGTVIVQAYAYTRRLGILDLELTDTGVQVSAYTYAAIDDSIAGDPATQNLIETYIDKLDEEVLGPLGYAFRQQVAETDFDLVRVAGEEYNLGDLVTDAIRWSVDRAQHDPADPSTDPVAFAVESNGVIRNPIVQGETGRIDVSDAFRVVPLGYDPAAPQGEQGGYPLLSFYLTGDEIRQACEVNASAYPILQDSDYWLSYSGLRFSYFGQGFPFNKVRHVWKCDEPVENDPACNAMTEIYINPYDTTLYKVAANYYLALNIGMLKEKSYGILDIQPKDRNGNLIEDLTDAIVYDADGKPVKQWQGFIDYLASFPDTDGDGVPDIPERYRNPQGRMVDACFVATVAYGSPFESRVQVFRDFRDRVLSGTAVGRALVDAYYTVGEPLAQTVDAHPWLKAFCRTLLAPLLGMAWMALLLV